MRFLCRLGFHSNYPQECGRWYVNDRCTRCLASLNKKKRRAKAWS